MKKFTVDELLEGAMRSPFRIKDYGYTPRVGNYVDYRDQRKTYKTQPKDTKKKIFPLIWSSDITTNGKLIHGRTSKIDKHALFINMGDIDNSGILKKPGLVLQRVTSTDQLRRLRLNPTRANFLVQRHS